MYFCYTNIPVSLQFTFVHLQRSFWIPSSFQYQCSVQWLIVIHYIVITNKYVHNKYLSLEWVHLCLGGNTKVRVPVPASRRNDLT